MLSCDLHQIEIKSEVVDRDNLLAKIFLSGEEVPYIGFGILLIYKAGS